MMMKFTIAALLAVAIAASSPQSINNAESKYVSNLLRSAKTLRNLQDAQDDFTVDISTYSVKFSKCQYVNSFDDDLAADASSETVLGTTRFAIFRLCPNNCQDNCNANYGEYILDLVTYLKLTVEYFTEYETEMCNACNANCGGNQRQLSSEAPRFLQTVDCTTCVDDCLKIQNMQANGYVDATVFLECTKIYEGEGDDAIVYYGGPICTYEGSKINIGVFSDANCQVYESDKKVEDYFEKDDAGNQAQLSHALLKMTYQDTCISCLEVDQNADADADANADAAEENANNDAQDANVVIQLCENLYNMAGKCEYSNGFVTGYYNVAGYENQQAQEDVICQFIKSIKAGTYTETGEINLTGASLSLGGGSSTTGGQKFALAFFMLGTVGLASYAAMLHSKLTKGPTTEAPIGSMA